MLSVGATIVSDDGQSRGKFDASPWFLQATDADIEALFEIDLTGGALAERVAWYCVDAAEARGDSAPRGIGVVIDYLERFNPKGRDGFFVGFEVTVSQREALLWLRENRPALWKNMRAKVETDSKETVAFGKDPKPSGRRKGSKNRPRNLPEPPPAAEERGRLIGGPG